MHQSLDLIGKITDNKLSLSWTKPSNYTSYNIKIDRCDARVDCYRIRDDRYDNISSYSLHDEVFTRCTTFNIHLEAADSRSVVRDEISLANRTAECWLTNEKMLVIILSAVLLLLTAVALLICYYHSKKVRRKVRSRLYSRLYSQERYQNVIKKSELKYFVENKLREVLPFAEEFERLEKLSWDTIERKTSIAESQANRRRNRYKDIVPYDYNRVPVSPAYKIAGDTDPSDYINASFVSDVFTGSGRKYIAAQGPGTDTTPAFWQMVWQYEVQVVVMLTNCTEGSGLHSVKCNKYWPDNVGDSRKFGDIQVQLFDRAEAPNYCVRKLDVTKCRGAGADTSRVIVHLQLTDWPDRSAPGSPGHLVTLVQLTQVLVATQSGGTPSQATPTRGPLLVHCSAGVGRTGTFISVDQIINNMDAVASSELDIFHTVYQLRKQRVYMVQTREQYEFLYKCVLHYHEIKQKQKKLSDVPSTAVSIF